MSDNTVFGLDMEDILEPVRVAQADNLPRSGAKNSSVVTVSYVYGAWRRDGRGPAWPALPPGSSAAELFAACGEPGCALLLDEQRQPCGVVVAAHVCARLWEENRSLTAALDTLLSTTSESVCAIDSNSRVTMWNQNAAQRYGISGQEILGRDIRDFFSNLIITKVRDNVLSNGQELRDKYHQPVAGEHVLINAAPILDRQTVLGAITSERDVTENMRLSIELARSNKRLDNLQREVDQANLKAEDPFIPFSGAAMEPVVATARQLSKSDASVLLRGEKGAGCHELARAIHMAGPRRERPFVTLEGTATSLAEITECLIKAEQGTLFLHDVDRLSPLLQSRLREELRQPGPDIRLLSSSASDIEALAEAGSFDQALYYRINVVCLEVPPLRRRRDVLIELIYDRLRQTCLRQGVAIRRLEPEAEAYLLNYAWPGNLPELTNVVERLVALAAGSTISASLLPAMIKYDQREQESFQVVLPDARDHTERELICRALQQSNGDRSRAARLLGIPRSTLYYKLNKYSISG